jgi:dTDP-4-amino-4,6-dideoxygalactose transaminase
MTHIYLSPPHVSDREREYVRQAFDNNCIGPLGPMVDAFEREFAAYTGIPHCAALSSGTAAMHLAVRHVVRAWRAGGGPARRKKPVVLASSLTFIGSVSPATFEGCELRFIDSEPESWNMDPALLEEELAQCCKAGALPAAVVPTDLYGQCCALPRIGDICRRYGVPVICDSAEAAGSRYREPDGAWRHAGHAAAAAVFSFNGNKIITTASGGMLASHDPELIAHARKMATQAREPAPHYEHTEIGFNYRMSGIAAAIGRGQLEVLDDRVLARRAIFEQYRQRLGPTRGITFMPEATGCRANRWLTVLLIDSDAFGATPERVRRHMEAGDIEARPVWKPMHLQPVFEACKFRSAAFGVETGRASVRRAAGRAVSEDLFLRGLCLPSGTALTENDMDAIAGRILACAG